MTRLDAELAHIREILREHRQGLSVTEIARALQKNKHSVGRYLDVLRASGQVEMRTYGMAKVFTLAQRLPVSSLLSIAEEPIMLLDDERRVIDANAAALALFGLPRERAVGQRLEFLPAPDPLIHDLVRQLDLAAAGQLSRSEIHLDGGDGRWYWCRAIPMVFEQGERGTALILGDITEHRRAEEALADSESLFRGLAENIQDGVLIYRDTELVFANRRVSEILGVPPGEDLGPDPLALVAPTDRAEAESVLRAHMADPLRPRVIRCRVLRGDGTERHLYVRLSAVEAEGGITRYLVLTDLTGWHRAEEEVRRQSLFVRHFLDEFPHPFYALDRDGRFVECNLAFAEMAGRGRAAILGAGVGEVVPAQDLPAFVAADDAVLAGDGERVYCTTLAMSGCPVRYLVRKSSLRLGEEGRPVVVGVLIGRPDLCAVP
jgi:PAS domain S-box-containing protein